MNRNGIAGVVILLLVSAICAAQTEIVPGNMRLLPGFVHHHAQGIDSMVGSIARRDGLVIKYDIGELAGVYTDCKLCGWTDGELWRRKQIIGGHEVRMVFTKSKRLVISFPEAHANFYTMIRSEADLADALLIVLTYNPS